MAQNSNNHFQKKDQNISKTMSLMVVIGYLSWYNRELTCMAKDGMINTYKNWLKSIIVVKSKTQQKNDKIW